MIVTLEVMIGFFMFFIQWYKIAVIQFIKDEQYEYNQLKNKIKETYLDNNKN
jgi:hypothetical protein